MGTPRGRGLAAIWPEINWLPGWAAFVALALLQVGVWMSGAPRVEGVPRVSGVPWLPLLALGNAVLLRSALPAVRSRGARAALYGCYICSVLGVLGVYSSVLATLWLSPVPGEYGSVLRAPPILCPIWFASALLALEPSFVLGIVTAAATSASRRYRAFVVMCLVVSAVFALLGLGMGAVGPLL